MAGGAEGLTLPSVGFFTLGRHSGDCTVFATQRRKIDNTIHLCTITLLTSIVCRFRHFQGQYLKSSAVCQQFDKSTFWRYSIPKRKSYDTLPEDFQGHQGDKRLQDCRRGHRLQDNHRR